MPFDAKLFAQWNVRSWIIFRETHRREEFRKAAPNLGPVWANALSELSNLIKKVVQGMLARIPESEIDEITRLGNPSIDPKTTVLLNLVKRLGDFPHSLSYRITEDKKVLISSSDRYLEGALYFGTRQLPRLRPIEFLVSRMSLRLQDPSIVFTARDFRKPHEIENDFKSENLRTVRPHYP
jgi:hypothetical protein